MAGARPIQPQGRLLAGYERGRSRRQSTRQAAELAALRAQEKHMNGTITGFGERVEAARLNAERLFRPGKRPVEVLTIGRGV